MRAFSVSLLLMTLSAAHAQDQAPGRVACDSKWLDLHKPDSEYQKYIQDCMKNQQSQARGAAKTAQQREATALERLRARAGWGTFEGEWTLPVMKIDDKIIWAPGSGKGNGTLVWKMADGKMNKIQVNELGACSIAQLEIFQLTPCFFLRERKANLIMLDWGPNQPPNSRIRSRVLEVPN
jgi:hypothetical protein